MKNKTKQKNKMILITDFGQYESFKDYKDSFEVNKKSKKQVKKALIKEHNKKLIELWVNQ